jgi:hypothetical protein
VLTWVAGGAALREFGDLEMAIMEVLRSGGDQDVTMRRFLERVNDDEIRSLWGALATAQSRRLAVPEACRPAGSTRGRGTGRIRTPTRT